MTKNKKMKPNQEGFGQKNLMGIKACNLSIAIRNLKKLWEKEEENTWFTK